MPKPPLKDLEKELGKKDHIGIRQPSNKTVQIFINVVKFNLDLSKFLIQMCEPSKCGLNLTCSSLGNSVATICLLNLNIYGAKELISHISDNKELSMA
jgi:hypothetical protein